MGLWWIYLCNTMNFYNLFCNTMYLCVYIYVFSLYICLSLSLLCLCLCTFLCPCHRYRSPWWPWRGVNPQITLPLSLWQCLYTFLCPHHDCHRPSRPCWDLIYLSLSICLAMYRSFYSLFVSIYIDIIYTYMCVCVCIASIYVSLSLSLCLCLCTFLCPHHGCHSPWRPGAAWTCGSRFWYLCVCYISIYTYLSFTSSRALTLPVPSYTMCLNIPPVQRGGDLSCGYPKLEVPLNHRKSSKTRYFLPSASPDSKLMELCPSRSSFEMLWQVRCRFSVHRPSPLDQNHPWNLWQNEIYTFKSRYLMTWTRDWKTRLQISKIW